MNCPCVRVHGENPWLKISKNPAICKFMIQFGRIDELGSGVTNINKYLPLYAKGAKPVFKETLHGFELTITRH